MYREAEQKSDGTVVPEEAVRQTKCFDQILEGSNKQDGLAVAAMLEAFIYQLKDELPYLMEITIQSDNSGRYQSKELLFMMSLLSSTSPIRISRFIHTETHDGKGLIDAHFARGTAHVYKFMRTSFRNHVRAISTAKGLAAALAWGGGVQNSFVQLASLDKKRLNALK